MIKQLATNVLHDTYTVKLQYLTRI